MSIELSAEHPHAVPSADAADAASHRVAMPPPVALPEDTDAPAGPTAAQAQSGDTSSTSTAGQGEVAAATPPPRMPLRRHSITFDGLLASPIDSLPFPEFRSSVAFKLVLVFLIALPFWVVPTNRLLAASKNTAPIYLTLAWYFIVSWLLGRLVAALRGPPAFGYLISGFILSFCVDDVWLAAKPYVQNLAFLIVLVRAGLEISPHDLRASTVALGTLPYVADAVAVAAYASSYYADQPGWSFSAFAMIGIVMTPLGDGLVIPGLSAFKPLNLGPMPQTMFTAAPLEVVVCLFAFGIVQDFSMSAHHVPVGAMIGLGIFVKLFGTIALALLIAYIFAQLAQNRNLYSAFGKPVFTGTDIEELLFVLAAVLIVYVLGNESPVTISNGYEASAALFQSDVGVIAVGFFYALLRPISIHSVETLLANVWMFGALFLFTSLGSNIKISSFLVGYKFIPFLLVGLAARLGMILLIAFALPLEDDRTFFVRSGARRTKIVYEALFAWVCSWPRATIQGALSKIPGNLGLFAPAVNSEILYAGIFTLAVCAPLGAVALDLLGGALLRKIKALEDQIQADEAAALTTDELRAAAVAPPPPAKRTEWRFRDHHLRRLASSLYSRAAFYARNGAGQAHALSSGIVSHVEDGAQGDAYNTNHGSHDGHGDSDHADHDNQHGSPRQQQADPRAIQRQVYEHMSPTQTRFASEHGGVAGGPSVLDMAARVEVRQPIMAELMRRGVSLGGVVDWVEAARNRHNVVMHHDEHHE